MSDQGEPLEGKHAQRFTGQGQNRHRGRSRGTPQALPARGGSDQAGDGGLGHAQFRPDHRESQETLRWRDRRAGAGRPEMSARADGIVLTESLAKGLKDEDRKHLTPEPADLVAAYQEVTRGLPGFEKKRQSFARPYSEALGKIDGEIDRQTKQPPFIQKVAPTVQPSPGPESKPVGTPPMPPKAEPSPVPAPPGLRRLRSRPLRRPSRPSRRRRRSLLPRLQRHLPPRRSRRHPWFGPWQHHRLLSHRLQRHHR